MKKVLITGSCGFVFSNFIRRAIYEKQPYQFISIDRIAGNSNALYFHKNHTFHIADIRDQHVIDKIFQFERPDIVIHGASEDLSENSSLDPNSFITSNILGTQVIINACLKHKAEKLIYISTDKVYGQLLNEQDLAWTENNLLNPRNSYAASKASGELLVKAANQAYGLIYNIARSSNNYGPRQTSDKFVPKVIKCILQNKEIPVYGQGEQIRDWTHVFDHCAAILTILNQGQPNETYNISANQEFSNIEVAQKICNAMEAGHNLIKYVPNPKMSPDFRHAMDSTKISNLGWEPQYKFKDGIVNTSEWFKINQWILK